MGSALVRIDGVGKTYLSERGRVQAVDDITLAVNQGEFVSLLGPSGCGKSTLLMMVAGLVRASRGTVTIGGVLVTKPYTDLGIVFQQDLLVDWRTVLGNIMIQIEIRKLDLPAYRTKAKALVDLVGLARFEDRFPHELSGGMRQRVAICRALVHDPPLILMDEPFGALDAMTREQLNLDLLKIWQQHRKTVLFVTHSISEAVFLSDRVIVMSSRPGRILEEVSIDLPRPRHLSVREGEGFAGYARRIRQVLYRSGALRDDQQ